MSRMEHTRQVLSAIFILSVLHCTVSTYFGDVFAQQADEPSKIGWLFSDSSVRTKRIQRAISEHKRESEDDGSPKIINGQCRDKLNRLCGDIDGNNDELMLLECIQTFKVCIVTQKNRGEYQRSNNCRYKLCSLPRYLGLIRSVRRQFGLTSRTLQIIKT